MSKKCLLLCVCLGDCPSFQKMDIFKVGNDPRRKKLIDYMAIHPQLCSTDGDKFLISLLKGDSEVELYVAGCDPIMQVKMFRDAMEAAEFGKERLHGVDIRNMDTEQAAAAIEKLVKGE